MSFSDKYKYIPKSTNRHSESIVIEDKDGNEKTIEIIVKEKPKIEHESKMWDDLMSLEEEVWSPNSEGLKTGFTSIDDAFDGGISPGFILIGGDSNLGKTAVLSQLAYNISKMNDNVFVMDFSLDDPFQDKISRIVACDAKITMNAVKNPKHYSKSKNIMERRKGGIIKLYNSTDRYKVYDATFTTDIEKIEEEIVKIKKENSKNGINKRIVVCIDNFHDLNSCKKQNLQEKQKYDYLAQYCADLAIRHNIPLLCTAELRKQNGTMRPSIDGVRESSKIKYEAKAILLCYNEVHYKGEGANIYFERGDKETKQPVLELHFAKNKISSFKGRLFFESYPEMAYMREPSERNSKIYSQIAYS